MSFLGFGTCLSALASTIDLLDNNEYSHNFHDMFVVKTIEIHPMSPDLLPFS